MFLQLMDLYASIVGGSLCFCSWWIFMFLQLVDLCISVLCGSIVLNVVQYSHRVGRYSSFISGVDFPRHSVAVQESIDTTRPSECCKLSPGRGRREAPAFLIESWSQVSPHGPCLHCVYHCLSHAAVRQSRDNSTFLQQPGQDIHMAFVSYISLLNFFITLIC